jgi:predicted transcriptional regulator
VKTAKDKVRELLETLPDDASLEEIQYRIYVRQNLDRGLKDLDEGRALTQEEMERRMAKWLDD